MGDDFKIVSVFSAQLGSTVDTCRCQATRLLEELHTILHVKWTFGDDFMFVSVSALRLVQRDHAET